MPQIRELSTLYKNKKCNIPKNTFLKELVLLSTKGRTEGSFRFVDPHRGARDESSEKVGPSLDKMKNKNNEIRVQEGVSSQKIGTILDFQLLCIYGSMLWLGWQLYNKGKQQIFFKLLLIMQSILYFIFRHQSM